MTEITPYDVEKLLNKRVQGLLGFLKSVTIGVRFTRLNSNPRKITDTGIVGIIRVHEMLLY